MFLPKPPAIRSRLHFHNYLKFDIGYWYPFSLIKLSQIIMKILKLDLIGISSADEFGEWLQIFTCK